MGDKDAGRQSVQASRELDVRVMIEVMGERALTELEVAHGIRLNPPRYSTDRSAALEVVDRLTERGATFVHLTVAADHAGVSVFARTDGSALSGEIAFVEAPTLPLAICRAALAPAVLEYLRTHSGSEVQRG